MTVAHQGVELKAIPYIDNTEPKGETVAEAETATPEPAVQERADRLSEESATRLRMIEKLMREAPSLRPVAALWPPSPAGLSAAPPPTPAAVAPPTLTVPPAPPPALFPLVQ
jgi:hypothetical protein